MNGSLAGPPAGVPERPPQQILDLRVQAPQLTGSPLFEGGVELAVEPQQEGLPFRQGAAVSRCRASRR